MRLIWANSILNWLYGEAISYPTPTSLSFFWSFGIMALICLASQILSGIFLAMHYIPSAELAFSSVEHIMWDVRGGWFLRYLHANGASMFFLVVYLHICRGIYYNSFYGKRQFVWYSGIIILFLMILTAFLGYVLPWGQMSFWAATVITSLASAIPLIGESIVAWLWGGFSVGEQTLVRFFSLHYLLPFILFALVAAHIILLHETGSNTPTGIALNWGDRITFGPYFFLKDLYFLVLFFILFMYFIFFNPNYLGHPDNYIPAMYMSTPAHIVPEWYFLPFYALLRSVPNKLGGVIVMLLSIAALALLPVLLNTSSKKFILNSNFIPERAVFFSFFIANSLLLGWIGGQPIEEPMYTVGQISSIFYFFIIFIIFPILNKLQDTTLNLYVKNVWWEDIYYLIKQFLHPLQIIRYFYKNKILSFRERRKRNQYYSFTRGENPNHPRDWVNLSIPFDISMDNFNKNIYLPADNYANEMLEKQLKLYGNRKIEQVEFIIQFNQFTPESEKKRIQSLPKINTIYKKVEDLKNSKTYKFFWIFFPKSNNITIINYKDYTRGYNNLNSFSSSNQTNENLINFKFLGEKFNNLLNLKKNTSNSQEEYKITIEKKLQNIFEIKKN